MAAPRFLLVTGKKQGGASSPRWPGVVGPLLGDAGPDGVWIAWRLAGANNRELGRSARVFPDLASCQASISALQSRIDDVEPLIAMDHISGLWGWQLAFDGATVAVSGRSYRRERECRYNLTQFLSAAPRARGATDDLRQRPNPQAGTRLSLAPEHKADVS